MPENWTSHGTNAAGEEYGFLQLENDELTAVVTNAGAALVSLECADRDGNRDNVTVTAPNPEYYLTNPSALGATPGRFANRIGRGQFELDGKAYNLAINNGPNHLHGGKIGFAKRVWELLHPQQDQVTFRLISEDGDEGYPGELTVLVTYRLEGNSLVLEYEATTDAPTVLNLTNHAYWNLSGQDKIYETVLQLNADRVLENDADVLPTGTILSVEGTPFDFRQPKPIGRDLDQLKTGYDCCFLINDWDQTLRRAALATDPQSGRTLEVLTTEPGVQLYISNHFNGSAASAGWQQHTAFCLECQHLPDAPNQKAFPSTVLRPGEKYTQTTVHRFGTVSTT